MGPGRKFGGGIVIGTRGSALALRQAEAVKDALVAKVPGLVVSLRTISTRGDRILDRPLPSLGDKGTFTKELDQALMAGEVDMCVHSMKDVPQRLPEGLAIGAMLPREDPRDALVFGSGTVEPMTPDRLPEGARIGTSSVRRAAQLRHMLPGIRIVDIRGNVETRVRKALGTGMDGAILAMAGLRRLGLEGMASSELPVEWMVPAPGQGAIGIEVRDGDERVAELCRTIDDEVTSLAVDAERRLSCALGGGCTAPFAAYARIERGDGRSGGQAAGWALDAMALSPDGCRSCRTRLDSQDPSSASLERLVEDALEELRSSGAETIMAERANPDAMAFEREDRDAMAADALDADASMAEGRDAAEAMPLARGGEDSA